MVAAVVATGCLGLLVAAASLTPDPAGHGTHTQLGLPACQWAMRFGKPCPTCGMTTAFAYAAKARLGSAFEAQPFGLLLAIVTAGAFWGALHVAVTGSDLGRLAAGWARPRVILVLAAAGLAAWAYKWVTWNAGG